MVDAKFQILVAFAKRRLPVPVAVLIVVLASALLLIALTPTTYESRTTLWVDPRASDALQSSDGLLSRFFLQRAESTDVLARVASTVGGSETAESIGEKLSISALRGTNAIVIAARASQAQQAADIANAVAAATIEQNRVDVITRTKAHGDALAAEVTRLDRAVAEASIRLAGETETAGITARQLEVVHLQAQAAIALRSATDFKAEQELQASAISVLERAAVPAVPLSSAAEIYMVAALVLGMVGATGALLLKERFDDLLWTTGALGKATQSQLPPILVSRGASSTSPHARASSELAAERSRSAHRALGTNPIGESALSLLCARLTTRFPGPLTVMVIPTSPDDDAARWVADGLATAGANANRNVTVLRGDGGSAANRVVEAAGTGSVVSMSVGSYAEIEKCLEGIDDRALTILVVPCALVNPLAISTSPLMRAVVFVGTAGASRFRDASDSALLVSSGGEMATAGVLVVGDPTRRPAAQVSSNLVQANA